jgi:hypothetical protein
MQISNPDIEPFFMSKLTDTTNFLALNIFTGDGVILLFTLYYYDTAGEIYCGLGAVSMYGI